MKKLLSLLCLSIAFGSAAYAQNKPVVIKYAHVGMANESQTRYAAELADLIKEKTKGEVTLQICPNSQLGGVAEMVDGIKMGAIGMGITISRRWASSCRTCRCSTRRTFTVMATMPSWPLRQKRHPFCAS